MQPLPLAVTVNVPALAMPSYVACDGKSENVHGCIRLKTVPKESLPAAEVVPRKLVAEAWITPASGVPPSLPPLKLYSVVNTPFFVILNTVPKLLDPPVEVVP